VETILTVYGSVTEAEAGLGGNAASA
jgi:hypothetical protein